MGTGDSESFALKQPQVERELQALLAVRVVPRGVVFVALALVTPLHVNSRCDLFF